MLNFYRETPDEMPKGSKPHYQIIFSTVIDNYPTEDELADAKRINQLLENYIRIDTTQYMLFHRLYKTHTTGIRYYR
ncbi:lipid A biosynthesis acyltransferase, partial [Halomonas sp. ND22Bw]